MKYHIIIPRFCSPATMQPLVEGQVEEQFMAPGIGHLNGLNDGTQYMLPGIGHFNED